MDDKKNNWRYERLGTIALEHLLFLTFICILLVQPSSAASERVFSILTNSFLPNRNHPLKTTFNCQLFYSTIIVKLWDCSFVQLTLSH